MHTAGLWAALALVIGGLLTSWITRKQEHSSRRAFWWIFAATFFLSHFLYHRGQLRAGCPLQDLGEIFSFSAWSLALFYLVTGSSYRLSLLGFFTAPLMAFFLIMSLLPGFLESPPLHPLTGSASHQAHAAFSLLSYGALGLSAVAAVMFLVLNRRLKAHRIERDLASALPPVNRLLKVSNRLALIGLSILTLGIALSFLNWQASESHHHLWVATLAWLGYSLLLACYRFRGMPPRLFALLQVGLFGLSLLVLALLA